MIRHSGRNLNLNYRRDKNAEKIKNNGREMTPMKSSAPFSAPRRWISRRRWTRETKTSRRKSRRKRLGLFGRANEKQADEAAADADAGNAHR